MATQAKLFNMSQLEMSKLFRFSSLSSALSIAIAVTATVASRLTTSHVTTSSPPVPPPTAFVATDVVINFLFLLVTIWACLTYLYQRKWSTDMDIRGLQNLICLPIISALALSVPFMSLATMFASSDQMPNRPLVLSHDVATSLASAFLLLFLWVYPSMWAHFQWTSAHPGWSFALSWKGVFCFIHASTRIAVSVLLKLHLEPAPLQSIISFGPLLFGSESGVISSVKWVSISAITLFELVIIGSIVCNYVAVNISVLNYKDVTKHHGIIAMRYYGKSTSYLYGTLLIVYITRIFILPFPRIYILQQYGHIILSDGIGNSAICLAILSHALRELYVHNSWKESHQSSLLPTVLSPRKGDKAELLYRVFDERDPSSQQPIPQHHTFSFESAILLFNMSWLAMEYAVKGRSPRVPADFGRPAYSVHSVIKSAKKGASAIIFQGEDRIIIVFKPVHHDVDKQWDQQKTSQLSMFGAWKKHSDVDADLDALPIRSLGHRDKKLLSKSKVHRGYAKAYGAIQERLLKELASLLVQGNRPVYITGHGSGGAVATLCGLDLCARQFSCYTKICVYTYGSPRLMNRAMVVLFESLVEFRWRCVVAGDAVSVQQGPSCFEHASKVATFTRSGHLALEYVRSDIWWQSSVSAHPMYTPSAYYCAFLEWHRAYHGRGALDLWDWPVDPNVSALFQQAPVACESFPRAESYMDSPTAEVESKSLRNIGAPNSDMDEFDIEAARSFARVDTMYHIIL